MVWYGPSPVTATAVALVKNVACKVLNIPQGRVLSLPKHIATPNRVSFDLVHESMPSDRSLVDLRQEIDKEVNRQIRADLPIKVYTNMTLSDLLNKFGGDVIDRYFDINESKFAKWLFNEYELIMEQPIWNNSYEKRGTKAMRKRYTKVDGIEIDMKEAVKQFLTEINGTEIDLIPEQAKKHFSRRRNWMKFTDQIPQDSKDNPNGKSDMELVLGGKWSHEMGVLDRVTDTNYENAHNDIKFGAWEIEGLANGMCLPNHFSRHWNSENIQTPINYLSSTGELGKIVVYQVRYRQWRTHAVHFRLDVFPGYNSQIIGPNPYYMFRETFNIKHLASIIPTEHDLPIPQLAVPIDFEQHQQSIATNSA